MVHNSRECCAVWHDMAAMAMAPYLELDSAIAICSSAKPSDVLHNCFRRHFYAERLLL